MNLIAAKDDENDTPLLLAARHQSWDIVKYLAIINPALLLDKDFDEKSALDYARYASDEPYNTLSDLEDIQKKYLTGEKNCAENSDSVTTPTTITLLTDTGISHTLLWKKPSASGTAGEEENPNHPESQLPAVDV